MLRCVACESKQVTKNGHIHNGKQRYRRKSCGRQFVYGATNKRISNENKVQVDELLLEKPSLAGIARVQGVSERGTPKWQSGYRSRREKGLSDRV